MSKLNLSPGKDIISASGKNSSGRIIVRFIDGLNIPYDEKAGEFLDKKEFKSWISLKKEYSGILIKPLFLNTGKERLTALVKRAKHLNPSYRDPGFLNYFVVTVPKDSDPQAVLKALTTWKELKKAYIEPVAVCPDPLSNFSSNPMASSQGYLDAAPAGISAKSVWSTPTAAGSDGAGIKFIDIETGWNLNHEDLTGCTGALIGTNSSPSQIPHGTSVLGILCASDNSKGCIGIAPNPGAVHVISITDYSIADAITLAASNLNYGDVLLIESQYEQLIGSTDFYVPVEVIDVVSSAISVAASAGIIVIEPGGDGDLNASAINFQTYLDPINFLTILNPLSPDFVDSGAVIVTASGSAVSATVTGTHEKSAWAPLGSRLDCYAWGENIVTLDSDAAGAVNNLYTSTFGFTSGASAIIAGAALIIQGMVKAATNLRLNPAAMRSLLKNPAYGSDLLATGTSTKLGIIMPDLYAIHSGFILGLPVFSVNISKTDVTSSGGSDGTATATPVNGMAPFAYSWNTTPVQNSQAASNLKAGTYTVTVTDGNGCTTTGIVVISEPGVITATVTKTDVTCNGADNGSISISGPSGGTPPYEFSKDGGVSWSAFSTFDSLAPGTYDVRIKDSTGLVKPLGSFTISEPAALSASVSSTNSTGTGLDNGSITITNPQGGSGSYMFSDDGGSHWQVSASFTPLGPGSYDIKMRDALNVDCVKDLGSVIITEPQSSLTVNASVTNIIKFGDCTGRIALTVSGGSAPYSVLWSNGSGSLTISNLCAGNYNVTVTDSASATVSLNATVRYLYAEIVRMPAHGITIKLLKCNAPPLFWTTRVYVARWKGHYHPPFPFHPYPRVYMHNVTESNIHEIDINGVAWTSATLKVPVSAEGDIVILPPLPGNIPVFPGHISIPVQIYLTTTGKFPWLGKQLLIAEFNLLISNTGINYTL
ncbi:MAG: hypothetical protein ABSG89_09600 [Bacteroidales bacterium]|jgi:hypothetical protein